MGMLEGQGCPQINVCIYIYIYIYMAGIWRQIQLAFAASQNAMTSHIICVVSLIQTVGLATSISVEAPKMQENKEPSKTHTEQLLGIHEQPGNAMKLGFGWQTGASIVCTMKVCQRRRAWRCTTSAQADARSFQGTN